MREAVSEQETLEFAQRLRRVPAPQQWAALHNAADFIQEQEAHHQEHHRREERMRPICVLCESQPNDCGPGCGCDHAPCVHDTNGLRAQLAEAQRERDEARAGYTKLDVNWARIHELAMSAIRNALGRPDATVPEIAVAITVALAALEQYTGIDTPHSHIARQAIAQIRGEHTEDRP